MRRERPGRPNGRRRPPSAAGGALALAPARALVHGVRSEGLRQVGLAGLLEFERVRQAALPLILLLRPASDGRH